MKSLRSPRTIGAAMGALMLAVALLSGIAHADTGTVEEDPAHLPAKQAVADAVGELLPTGHKGVDKQLDKGLADLAEGLAAELWLDDSTLSDDGVNAFTADKRAVEQFEKAIAKAPGGSADLIAVLDASIDALVTIDAALAGDAIEGAGADAATALDKMAEAEEKLAAGDRAQAIDRYAEAWTAAGQADEASNDSQGSDSARRGALKWSEYTFWFVNIETGEMTGPLSGTSHPDDPLGYTGKSNEGYLAVGEELMQLHVSCSDAFPDGVGASSDPSLASPWRVDRYSITKFKEGREVTTCGLVGMERPELAVDKTYSNNGGATFEQGGDGQAVFTDEHIIFRFVVTNTGNVAMDDVTVTDDVFGALTTANPDCSVATLAPGGSFECRVDGGALPASVHTSAATVSGSYAGSSYSATDTVTFIVEELEIV